IKREISTMKLVRHPNIILTSAAFLVYVMASKTKIYIVLELVTGGELFDKIASQGRLKEDEARKYFQQLICAVDYCHSRGVCHRDLKRETHGKETEGRKVDSLACFTLQPENLLLGADGGKKMHYYSHYFYLE
ncbi:hypothetical protein HN51_069888, partial [Arachis hypogaea]